MVGMMMTMRRERLLKFFDLGCNNAWIFTTHESRGCIEKVYLVDHIERFCGKVRD